MRAHNKAVKMVHTVQLKDTQFLTVLKREIPTLQNGTFTNLACSQTFLTINSLSGRFLCMDIGTKVI